MELALSITKVLTRFGCYTWDTSLVRYPLKKPEIFLKRNNHEVGIYNYNKDILHLFGSTMDIQLILDEYAVASYILNYVVKSDVNLTKMLQQMANKK